MVHVVLAPGKLDSSVEKKLFTEVMVPAFKRATDEEVQARKEAAQIRADLQSCSEDDDDASSCSGSDANEAAAARVLHYDEDGVDEAPASPQVEQDEGAVIGNEQDAPQPLDADVIVPRTLYTWDSALSTCELFEELIEKCGPLLGVDIVIDLMKYAAAATALQQPADKSRVFPMLHRHTRNHPYSARKRDLEALLRDAGDSSRPALLVRRVSALLGDKVPPGRKNMLLQFWAQVPDLFDSALRGDFVRGGWTAAGISMNPRAEEILSKWTSWALASDARKAELVKGCHELVEVLIEKGKLSEEDYRAKLKVEVRSVDNKPLSWRYCVWVNNEVRIEQLRRAQREANELLERKLAQQHERANAKVGERKCRTCARTTTDGKERVVNRWDARDVRAHEWIGCEWCDWYACGDCCPSVRVRCDACTALFDLDVTCPACSAKPKSLVVALHQGLTHAMSRQLPKPKAPAKPRAKPKANARKAVGPADADTAPKRRKQKALQKPN